MRKENGIIVKGLVIMQDIMTKITKYTGMIKLSNSEVITPMNIVKDMIDLLPADVFTSSTKFLDPAVKSGRFLIEVYNRLMTSIDLIKDYPNEAKRKEHILTEQLFGIATSEAAADIVRKALYDNPNKIGNIRYIEDYIQKIKSKNTDYKELMQKEFNGDMNFDVVIGNPPYQETSGGGGYAGGGSPIYHKFIDLGIGVGRITCMITKNSWLTSDTLKSTRDNVINTGLVRLINYPLVDEIFSGVDVSTSIFVVEHKHKCVTNYTEVRHKTVHSEYCNLLYGYEVIPESAEAYNIIKKVKLDGNVTFYKNVYTDPFGIRSNGKLTSGNRYVDQSELATNYYNIPILYKDSVKYINNNDIVKNNNLMGHYKIIASYVINKNKTTLANIRGLAPNQVCSGNYSMLFHSENQQVAMAAYKYICTRFLRILVYLSTDTLCTTAPARFKLVPNQDFTLNSDIDWSQSIADIDKQLYKKYKLTQEEIGYIESTIKPMT